MAETDSEEGGARRAVILGCQASLVAGVLLVVVGIAAGPGVNLAAPFAYLVGSTMIFGLAARTVAARDTTHKVRAALGVAFIGPFVPSLISLLTGDGRDPMIVQVALTVILVWLPAFVGAAAGAAVAAIRGPRLQ